MKNFLFSLILLGCFVHVTAQSNEAFLGVNSNQVHPNKAALLEFPEPYGYYLTNIVKGSAAEKSDLRPFDYVYQIGDYKLDGNTSLGSALDNYKPGDKVKVKYIREGKKQTKSIKLGDTSQRSHTTRASNEDPFLGIHQTHWNGGEPRGIKVNIGDNTTADIIGMEDGDIVTKIDQFPILDWHDAGAAIDYREVCDEITVTVLRDGVEMNFTGTIQSEDGPGDCENKAGQIANLIQNQSSYKLDVDMEEVSTEERDDFKNRLGIDMPEVSDLMVESLNLFPNPNIGQFEVSFNLNGTGDVLLRIYDSQGRVMISRDLREFSGNFQGSFDLGNSPAGVYYLMVRQGDQSMTRKIIVSRN